MKKANRQLKFDDPRLKKMKAFGGSLLRNKKNRTARPLSAKHPLHIVLKSSQASGAWGFLQPRNRKVIERTLKQMTKRYGVRLIEVGICQNHFHLLVRFQSRRLLIHFLRVVTGTMVRRICGKQKLAKRFFDFRPFSRIVESFRGYKIAKDYVFLNHLEGLGIIPYQQSRTRGISFGDFADNWLIPLEVI